MTEFMARTIGRVESTLRSRADAPRQGDEGAPGAVLVLDDDVVPALEGLAAGDEILVLTWLHEAARDTLAVHARGDVTRPAQGVFSTRSPDRPNPIGLHPVRVLEVDGARLHVTGLEAIDGTPVIDIKPVLGAPEAR
jgi:tRNA-Thr(GGU) m(6)t(6)A37 methyltransferase TsaA